MIPLELSHTQNSFEIVGFFRASVQSVLTRLTLIKFMDTETGRMQSHEKYRGKALSDDLYLSCSDRCFRRMKSLGGDLVPSCGILERQSPENSLFKKKKKFFFNWRRIALKCCIGFCCITTWISHNYTFIFPFLKTFLWSLESEALFTGSGWIHRHCWWVSAPWSLGTAVLL